MNFWDYDAWTIVLQLGIILTAIIICNIIRRKIKFIRNSLLPTSVLAGLMIFIINFIPAVNNYINRDLMEMLTYHCLGLGFIALALKTNQIKKDHNKLVIVDTGLITVNGYLIQGIVGLTLSLVLSFTIFPSLFHAAGLLLPMGFGQGTGQALNFGKIYEGLGFENGATFGLSIAAIGFLIACIIGVIYLNVLKRKGRLKVQEERIANNGLSTDDIYAEDEAPLNEAVDKLTIQFAVVFLVYLITYFVIFGLSYLSERFLGNFGTNTLKPLFWGFNFLFGSLFAFIIKKILVALKNKKIMKHTYVNNYMLNRLSGFFFDIMIVAGIAAIDWNNLSGLLWPLLIICAFGAFATFVYVRFICHKVYPEYEHEAFFSMFGMLTGTASTGMILLREIDPNFETPAAQNLVLQQVPAIAFGFPVILLVSFAGKDLTSSLITLAIIVPMFVGYNVFLLRKYIFKKKEKKIDINNK